MYEPTELKRKTDDTKQCLWRDVGVAADMGQDRVTARIKRAIPCLRQKTIRNPTKTEGPEFLLLRDAVYHVSAKEPHPKQQRDHRALANTHHLIATHQDFFPA